VYWQNTCHTNHSLRKGMQKNVQNIKQFFVQCQGALKQCAFPGVN